MTPQSRLAPDDRAAVSDRILASVYADKDFMTGVRRAMQEIEDGKQGTHFRDLKRKANG